MARHKSAFVVLSLVLCAGCGSTSRHASTDSDSQTIHGYSENLVLETLYGNSQMGASVAIPPTLLDGLPGSDFSKHMMPAVRSTIVVTGIVTDVEAGQTYVFDTVEGMDIPVPPDNSEIDTLVLQVSMDVRSTICTVDPAPQSLVFDLPASPPVSPGELKAAFDDLGEIALFLHEDPGPDESRGLQMTASILLSPVSSNNEIPWGLATDTMGNEFAKGATTLASLKAACTLNTE